MKSKNIFNATTSRAIFRERFCGLLASALCLIAIFNSPAAARQAFVVDVIRAKPYDHVLASASIRGAFTPEIIETIQSGAPVTFTYFIQLKRHRPIIWNETVRELAIKRMVKFDTLKKEYLTWEKRAEDEDEIDFELELKALEFKRGERGEPEAKPAPGSTAPAAGSGGKTAADPVALKNLKELERWMTHLEKVDLGPAKGLDRYTRYYIRVRCEMKSIKLIPPFNYILFFVSFWDFDTDWGSSTPFTINQAVEEKSEGRKTGN